MTQFGWKENIKIEIKDLSGSILDTTEFTNLVTNAGLNFLADALRKSTQTSDIKYLAWGSDNTAVNSTNTVLGTEAGRKLITTAASSGTGKCFNVCYIAPTEAIGAIEELGWFAGEDAEATADTGVMVSHVLYSHTKTALESITITRTDTFTTT